jgi:hypothetical protein
LVPVVVVVVTTEPVVVVEKCVLVPANKSRQEEQ